MPDEANKNICVPYQPGLFKTIMDTHPDILVGDGFFQWTYAALLLRIGMGIPLVICYERWKHTERNAQWYRKLYRKTALRFTDAVCCNGKLSCEYTRSLGIPLERITTGHMVADTQSLALSSANVSSAEKSKLRMDWRLQGTVFLYVGQLIERKGIAHLLDAWAKLENTNADATLLIVGDGPAKRMLVNQKGCLGLKHVCFTGPVEYGRIAYYYAAADVFIIPTLEDNWSLVVPEAMACGLPILCSKYNGCWPELVRDGINGWIFDPLDSEDVFNCLKETIKSKDAFARMGGESRSIIANHTPQKAAGAIYSACEMALKNKHKF